MGLTYATSSQQRVQELLHEKCDIVEVARSLFLKAKHQRPCWGSKAIDPPGVTGNVLYWQSRYCWLDRGLRSQHPGLHLLVGNGKSSMERAQLATYFRTL